MQIRRVSFKPSWFYWETATALYAVTGGRCVILETDLHITPLNAAEEIIAEIEKREGENLKFFCLERRGLRQHEAAVHRDCSGIVDVRWFSPKSPIGKNELKELFGEYLDEHSPEPPSFLV